MAVEHVVGELDDGVQRCTRCRAVLLDHRLTESADGGRSITWETGARVVVAGRAIALREVFRGPADPCQTAT